MAWTNQVINGSDILLSVDGNPVGCATSHSIEITNATREVACKNSGDWTDAEYGRFSWTVTTDALLNLGLDDATYVDYPALVTLMTSKAVITVDSEYVEGAGSYKLSGNAIITSISKTAGDNENVSYSVSLQGKGALTQTEVVPV